ncbi:MAG: RHS repeat-associated core domain-containing protein [Candidatus Binataceae bacterium]
MAGCSIVEQLRRDPGAFDNCAVPAQAAATAFRAGCGPSACCDVGGLTVALDIECVCPLTPPAASPGHGPTCGDPVDMASGIFTYDHTDLTVADVMPLQLTRSYREFDPVSRAFGVGMSDNYDMYLIGDANGGWTSATLVLPNAAEVPYQQTSAGIGVQGVAFQNTSTPGMYFGSTITFGTYGWTLALRDGTQMLFGPRSMLSSITDRNGNTVQIQRTATSTQITSPNGRWILLNYDGNGRVYSAQDNTGRTTWYIYNAAGYLTKFYDANGGLTSYSYDGANRMVSYTTPNGNIRGKNQYDSNSRVILQTQPDGGQYNFSYLLDGNNNVTEADMTDPIGSSCNLTFDSNGYSLSDTWAVGRPEQQATTFSRAPNTELLNSMTDQLGRTTAFTYDAKGNTTSVTRLSGTSQAVTTSATYDPTFSQISSVTDPLSNTWTVGLDGHGNATSVTDPLGNLTTATYNTEGQLASVTNPTSNTTSLAYAAGLLAGITDPLGNQTTISSDGVGRPIQFKDPLGYLSSYTYDSLDNLTSVIDAIGATTAFTYDADSNLLTLIDANGNLTSYAYDGMDRATRRIDPLGQSDRYTFDGNSNLTQHVDRRGKVAVYQYDGVNRRTFAGFGQNGSSYESTIAYTWDAGNRLTQALDSLAGAINRQFDGLDRLAQEQTPQGAVNYTYDNGSRRATLAVQPAGTAQNAVNSSYSWDVANRLLGITQGVNAVGFTYDSSNRRTCLTLPNGVIATYGYDADSRLISMTYGTGGNCASAPSNLGTLTYAYDADGRRTAKGGTLATGGLPAAVAGTSYNADNEQTNFAGPAFAYDANGNLTTDAANSYTWDARNHLTAIGGGTAANFVYDALGRRISKTIGGATTQFLYDGSNPVQELDSGNNVLASMLTGLDIDEYLARTDASGTSAFLTDALGSTVGLVGSAGSITTSYTYDPFGNTTVSGSSSNPYQFTGRENDGTGLYFDRARYYSSTYQRFVSQDPIGFRGGDSNLFAYVSNGTTNWIDPQGLLKPPSDPSGLPPGWSPDPTHQYPFGQRYKDPFGRWLDWHPGNPTSSRGGWNQRPHWHCSTRPGQHLQPGEDIPELDVPPPGGGNPSSAPPGDQMPPEVPGANPAPEAAPPPTVPEGGVSVPDDIPITEFPFTIDLF